MRNGVLLGDSGYPNLEYLITPLLRPTSVKERRFNKAHKRTRRLIECAIGVLKQKFRILLGTMMYHPVPAAKIIKCCVTLHNIFLETSDAATFELDDSESMDSQPDQSEYDSDIDENESFSRRQQLIDLF